MDPVDQILHALAANRLRIAPRLDELLGTLAAWMEEHPKAEVEEVLAQPEAVEALRLIDAEIRANSGVLIESLPAAVSRA